MNIDSLLVNEYVDAQFYKNFYYKNFTSETFDLSLDKLDGKNNIVKYFRRKSSVVHFPPALQLSAI